LRGLTIPETVSIDLDLVHHKKGFTLRNCPTIYTDDGMILIHTDGFVAESLLIMERRINIQIGV